MRKTLAAIAATLTISATPAMAYQYPYETFTANLPNGYLVMLTTAECRIPMTSPTGQPLHKAMAIAYRRVYRGCWYTEPRKQWFRIRIINATGGWEYMPKDIFLEQKNG